jgi:hypothetical protein
MADVTASTAVGVAAFPLLAAIGIDPASIAAGLAGCVVVQTLLPSEQHGFVRVALMTLGSVLFASLTAPFVSPLAVSYALEHYSRASISPDAVKAAVAATLGGFAQPILFLIRAAVQARIARQTAKEEPNA